MSKTEGQRCSFGLVINMMLPFSNVTTKLEAPIKFLLVAGLALLVVACAATGPGIDVGGQKAPKVQPKVDPKVAAAYESALSALRDGRSAEAEKALLALSEQNPTFSGPHANLGIIYFHANKMEQAKSEFQKALQLNPENVVCLNHLGIISRNEGKFKQAYDYYEKALQIDPDYAYAHRNFGILLELYMGKLPEALEHYKRYQELTKEEDQEVKKWIVDLARRVKK
jgi:tetratricopeptide (TPR) repeat protein